MKHLIKLTRPYQWVKNIFILLPLFFGGALTDTQSVIYALMAFFAYSFAASAIYCYNDIIDVEDDRKHSEKCNRPIASGAVSITQGYVIMALMVVLSAVIIVFMGERALYVGGVVATYFVLDILYCRLLKHYAIVDVCVLSFGFVLRILAGGFATDILPSHWLVMMTFLLTLFLSFAKRRDDVVRMMKTGEAPRHNTERYNLTFINQAVTITASVTLVCYIMYTISPAVIERTGSEYLYLTSVFVILGLLRYMQLTLVDEKTGDPTKMLYSDHFLQLVIAMWSAAYLIIIYNPFS